MLRWRHCQHSAAQSFESLRGVARSSSRCSSWSGVASGDELSAPADGAMNLRLPCISNRSRIRFPSGPMIPSCIQRHSVPVDGFEGKRRLATVSRTGCSSESTTEREDDILELPRIVSNNHGGEPTRRNRANYGPNGAILLQPRSQQDPRETRGRVLSVGSL